MVEGNLFKRDLVYVFNTNSNLKLKYKVDGVDKHYIDYSASLHGYQIASMTIKNATEIEIYVDA